MTAPSIDPGSPSAPRAGSDSRPSDGSAPVRTDDSPDPPDDDPRTSFEDGPADSALTAIVVAVGLGVLGPLIAIAGGIGVFAVDAIVDLSLTAQILLTLFVGQYVAFAGLAIAYLVKRGFDRSQIVAYLGVRRPTLVEFGIVVGGWVLILLLIVAISALIQFVGVETAANQSAELAIANPAIVPLFVAASFLVIGPCEELLYRGVVQGRLRESMPAAPAIAIAAAVFALIHVMALTGGISGRLTTVAVLFVPSLVFGAVYEYTENIVVPALLHGLHNAVIFTLLYLSVVYADEFEGMADAAWVFVPV